MSTNHDSNDNKRDGTSAKVEFNLDDSLEESEEHLETGHSKSSNGTTIPASLEERLNNPVTTPQPKRPSNASKVRSNLLRARQSAVGQGGMISKQNTPIRYSNVNSVPLINRLLVSSTLSPLLTRPYLSKKRLPSRVPKMHVKKEGFIVNERIEEYINKRNAFIEKQVPLKFNANGSIGKTIKTYSNSMTASDIKLSIRNMKDNQLLDSLIKNMDALLEEHNELIQVMESMSKEMVELKQLYNKSEQSLESVTNQLDDTNTIIEELKRQNKQLRLESVNVNTKDDGNT